MKNLRCTSLGGVPIRPRILPCLDREIEHDVFFSEIQETVVQGIRDAKFLVWAAVAWFSNEAIFNKLEIKKAVGLNIRVIVSDEDSNARLLHRLRENFDVVVLQRPRG